MIVNWSFSYFSDKDVRVLVSFFNDECIFVFLCKALNFKALFSSALYDSRNNKQLCQSLLLSSKGSAAMNSTRLIQVIFLLFLASTSKQKGANY